jgi:hypothetical protein
VVPAGGPVSAGRPRPRRIRWRTPAADQSGQLGAGGGRLSAHEEVAHSPLASRTSCPPKPAADLRYPVEHIDATAGRPRVADGDKMNQTLETHNLGGALARQGERAGQTLCTQV